MRMTPADGARFIIVNGTILAYRVAGERLDAARRVLVFLHGWGRTRDDFDDLVGRLFPHFSDCAFLQLDLPGFGGSPLTRPDGLSLDDYCNILKDFFHKLGLARVTLIGHSLGGRITIKFAALYPDLVEKLILISAAGIRPRSFRRTLLGAGRALFKTVFFAVRDFTFILRLKNLLGAAFGSRDYQTAHEALRETLKKVLAEDLRQDAKKISAPTLLVWGAQDQITPLRDCEEYHSLIRGSQLEVLDGGHFAFLQNPGKCAELIASFLQNG